MRIIRKSRDVNEHDENLARSYLADYDQESSAKCHLSTLANWNYATNITEENERIKLQASLDYAQFEKESWKNLTTKFKNWRKFQDPDLRRMFKKIVDLGSAALSDDDFKEVKKYFF